jgi:hypothetical protein
MTNQSSVGMDLGLFKVRTQFHVWMGPWSIGSEVNFKRKGKLESLEKGPLWQMSISAHFSRMCGFIKCRLLDICMFDKCCNKKQSEIRIGGERGGGGGGF